MRVAKSSVNDTFHPNMKSLSSWDVSTYEGDIFTSDGIHFVGDDGFVVPNSFEEMETRYPNYVRNWVCRRLKKLPFDSVVEDWASELSLFLRDLPETSKTKARGFKDVVDVYNPWASFGASAKRFFGYINRCLANKHYTICVKMRKDALNVHNLISIHPPTSEGGDPEIGGGNDGIEGYLVSQSSILQEMIDNHESNTFKALFIEKFLSYVEVQRPDLVPVAKAIMFEEKNSSKTENGEKAKGSTKFQKEKRALITLGKNYLKGVAVASAR